MTTMEVDSRNNRPELIHPGHMRNALPRVLGIAGESEGLGPVERYAVSHFARCMRVCALECGLLRCLGLLVLACRRFCYKGSTGLD